ncbi:MAG: hypothetical protein V2A79_10700 [Planctomycetota bacterium]
MSHSVLLTLVCCVAMAGFGLVMGCGPGGAGGGGRTGDRHDNANQNDNGTDDNANENGGGIDGPTNAIIADHTAANEFDSIPDEFITAARAAYRIFYGHTSHGSQIITGMEMAADEDNRLAFNAGPDSLRMEENDTVDLGYAGDLDWVVTTRDVLGRPDGDINLVMWSWCGAVSDSTEEGIDAYLEAMDQLETDYPDVVFVYMTGHLDGTGSSGNLYLRNNQIRDYCTANDKVLFDFADIESYDPEGNYYPDGTDYCDWCVDWCAEHTCPTSCDDEAEQCAHSRCFNCYRKARAFWWMMARIAGWNGP